MQPVAYGRAEPVAPLVRRVVAPNPSPFTKDGTNSYIVGEAKVAVIDPGPDVAAHLDALAAAIGDAEVVAVLVTHSHRDHSMGARPLAARLGAPLLGGPAIVFADGPKADAGFDPDYAPDRALADGERIDGGDWTLEVVATPGHTSNHLCFALSPGRVLFSGDHVMGWSTTVIVPPDGDMGAYMASLEKLLDRDEGRYLPGHGDPVDNPRRLVRGQLGHRKHREGQILRLLGEGVDAVPALVERMYVGLDRRLVGAAGLSVQAHLEEVRRRGLVEEREGAWHVC